MNFMLNYRECVSLKISKAAVIINDKWNSFSNERGIRTRMSPTVNELFVINMMTWWSVQAMQITFVVAVMKPSLLH